MEPDVPAMGKLLVSFRERSAAARKYGRPDPSTAGAVGRKGG
jgi:hypothetical protein